jgi:hypothetical protein
MAIDISKSVGRGGENLKSDTKKIQKALNHVYPNLLLDVDGDCGKTTIRRIDKFQSRSTKKPDGRFTPGGQALRKLSSAVPSLSEDWSGDSSKWSAEKKLASLDPRMRGKVERTLATLHERGFKPKVFFAWRSVAVQLALVEKGNSTVRFSFHNAQKPNGRPNAYAVDIIDRRWAWNEEAETNGFWQALGTAGKAEGLYWGGDWRSFKDWAHLQYHPNTELAAVRRESGLA